MRDSDLRRTSLECADERGRAEAGLLRGEEGVRRAASAERAEAGLAVLVVTKADLGAVAQRAVRDLRTALRSLGAGAPVLAVSALPPAAGVDALADALADFTAEHGEAGLRALGGRRAAQAFLAARDPGLGSPALLRALEEQAAQT